MSQFKVGDKVIIRDDLIHGLYDNILFAGGMMKKYLGKEAIITGYNSTVHTYILDIDKGFYRWSAAMFKESTSDISRLPEVYDEKTSKILLKTVNESLAAKSNELQSLKNEIITLYEKKRDLSDECKELIKVATLLENQLKLTSEIKESL